MRTFVFALLFAGAASAAQTFQVPGCTATAPAAINDLNEVVGTATCNGLATGVNIHGAIVGSYSIPDCSPISDSGSLNLCEFGYVRSPDGAITTLNLPDVEITFVRPVAINASGQIAGNVLLASRPQVFLLNGDGQFISPGPPGGFCCAGGIITGLADTGAVVGVGEILFGFAPEASLRIPAPPSPPFGANGVVTILGRPSAFAYALGIDRLGAHIIGYAGGSTPPPDATLTTQGFIQTPTGLPKFFSVDFTATANFTPQVSGGVNSHGEGVLGDVRVAPNGATTTITIPDCIAVSSQAINDLGWVTGSCTHAGQTVGFLWRE
jgi:hypothetical protein